MLRAPAVMLTRVVGLTAIAAVATHGPLQGQEPSLATVMERAASYVTTFQYRLSNIVAEERYVQDISRMNLPPGRFATESHRELRSELTTVGELSGSLMLVAPGSNVSVVGPLPSGAAATAAAVDRIVGQRSEDHSNSPVADAEALAIARRDVEAITRVAGRFAKFNPELTAEQARELAIERGIHLAHDARMRREVMYAAVLQCLDWLASQPGRRSLVVVSGGFARDPDDSKYDEVVTRSHHANAPMHVLDARGLQGNGRYQDVAYGAGLSRAADEGPFGWSEAAAGSADLADDTGGISIGNTNDMEKGLGRLLGTMTTYYTLAYRPPSHERPGYRTIKVEVRTRGLHVRARRGYLSGAPDRR
jgi:VWFA-related protein